jgi:Rho-binding antiterminator
MADMPDYRPIACDLYSEYELAILQRRRLRLTWNADNVVHTRVVRPLDLKTENKQEFLLCETDTGEPLRIRLDQVRNMELAA